MLGFDISDLDRQAVLWPNWIGRILRHFVPVPDQKLSWVCRHQQSTRKALYYSNPDVLRNSAKIGVRIAIENDPKLLWAAELSTALQIPLNQTTKYILGLQRATREHAKVTRDPPDAVPFPLEADQWPLNLDPDSWMFRPESWKLIPSPQCIISSKNSKFIENCSASKIQETMLKAFGKKHSPRNTVRLICLSKCVYWIYMSHRQKCC